MWKFMRSTILAAAMLSLIACGGGTSTNVGNPITTVVELQAALSEAKTTLAAGSISEAKDLYSAIIERVEAGQAAKSLNKALGDALNADEARVGRALCSLLLLPEDAVSATILANFGQGAWDVEASVFDEQTGFLARAWNDGNPQAADFSALPFQNIRPCRREHNRSEYRCIVSRVSPGYTVEDLAADLQDLSDGVISDVITDLTLALEDSDVSFNIPQALYTGDRDINLHHADIKQLLAGMYMWQAAIDLANSYRFDVDMSLLIDEDGTALITKAGLVNLLNQQFALRPGHHLAQAENHLRLGFSYSVDALEEILAGAQNGTLVVDNDNDVIFEDLYAGAQAALESLGEPTFISGIIPSIEADLDAFFNNPFDGSEIEIEPFVVEEGHIRAVEAYWQEAVDTALVGYTLGDSVEVFSEATQQIGFIDSALFKPLKDMRIGKWYVMKE